MYLYLVTCVSKSRWSKETLDVYVVASNSDKANEAALQLMRALSYKYSDYFEKTELLASVNNRAPSLLVIDNA